MIKIKIKNLLIFITILGVIPGVNYFAQGLSDSHINIQNVIFPSQTVHRIVRSGKIDLGHLLSSDGKLLPFYKWDERFKEIADNPSYETETTIIYIDRGEKGIYKFEIEIPKESSLFNPRDYDRVVAAYVMLKIYSYLSLTGGKRVILSSTDRLFNLVKEQFENLGDPSRSMGSYLDLVYELEGDRKFDIVKAEEYDQARLDEAESVEILITQGQRINLLTKDEMHGKVVAMDFGGSDIKIALMSDGEAKFEKKFKWDAGSLSNPQLHQDIAVKLINLARLHDSLSQMDSEERLTTSELIDLYDDVANSQNIDNMSLVEIVLLLKKAQDLGIELADIDALGISWAGAVNNDRITGPSPIVGGLNMDNPIIREHVATLGIRIAGDIGLSSDKVKVVNDGDAGAAWAAVELGLSNTLAWSMGTGLAAGYVDKEGRIAVDMLTEMGNIVMDMSQLYAEEPIAHSVTKVPGALQQYLSQRAVVRAVQETELLDLTQAKFLTSEGKIDKRAVLLEVQRLYEEENSPEAERIFENIGMSLAYAALQVYNLIGMENIIIFGQVSEGKAGRKIRETAQKILDKNYGELGITLHLASDPAFAQAYGVGYIAYQLIGP